MVALPVNDQQVANGGLRNFGLNAQAEAFVPICNIHRDESSQQTSSSAEDNNSLTDRHSPVQTSPVVSDAAYAAQPASSGWDHLYGLDHDPFQEYMRENLVEFTWNNGELRASPLVDDLSPLSLPPLGFQASVNSHGKARHTPCDSFSSLSRAIYDSHSYEATELWSSTLSDSTEAPVALSGGDRAQVTPLGGQKFYMRFNFKFCWRLASW